MVNDISVSEKVHTNIVVDKIPWICHTQKKKKKKKKKKKYHAL